MANFGRVQNTPFVAGGIVAALAAAMIAHTLVTSVRRRRRDLALLKTLGFVRRQVTVTVAWQATTLTVIALVVGIPLGVGASRWAWTLFAHSLGIVPEPVTPPLALLLVVPAAVLVANLVAAVPGWVAARTQPAVVLRTA